MEPILPEPITQNNQEAPTADVQPVEYVAPLPEVAPNTRPEQSHESAPQGSSLQPIVPVATPLQVMPQPMQSSQVDDLTATSPDPVIADDVDVIEKEWVDKAKKIVSATKEDPYTQEREVSKLQADYLSKRYNKNLKLAE